MNIRKAFYQALVDIALHIPVVDVMVCMAIALYCGTRPWLWWTLQCV